MFVDDLALKTWIYHIVGVSGKSDVIKSSIRDLLVDGLLHYGFPMLSIAMGQSEGMLRCYIHPRNTFFCRFMDFEFFKYLSTSSHLGAGKCIFFLRMCQTMELFPMFDFR
jgi:hypothetical protein